MAGIKDKSFHDRQGALRAIRDICGIDGLLFPQPDAVVARAFGQRADDLPIELVWHGLEAGIDAKNVTELESAVDDVQKQLRRRVDLRRLRTWDREVGEFFSARLGGCYASVDPKLKQLAKEAGFARHEAVQMARLLAAVRLTEDPLSRHFTLIGLAARAGLMSESDLEILDNPAVQEAEKLAGLEELWKQVQSSYDDSLDGFVDIYVHYHGFLAATGGTSEHNDCLDLEPFVYFESSVQTQKYLTGEDKWLKIVRLVDESRAVDVKSLGRTETVDSNAMHGTTD